MTEPLVSVVVATYRRNDELIRALESLAVQTYKNYEIVLVDDNDDPEWNERVLDIVKDFKDKFGGAELVFHVNHPNQGSAKTRNIGIELAKGKYITFLDDDDEYLPEKIHHHVSAMTDSDADYCITDIFLYNDEGKLIDKRIRSYIREFDPASLQEYHLKYHMTGTDSMMFKREYLLSIGGFDSIDLGDEFYLMQKAIRNSGKFCYAPGSYIRAYVHTGETGLSSGQNKIKCENMLYEYKKTFFDDISNKCRRYICMRHYAVLAFAELRMKRFLRVIKCGICSFVYAPVECCKLVVTRKI